MLLKSFFKMQLKASTLLESAIALSIVSICLFVAIMVYSAVFTTNTSVGMHRQDIKLDEAFFAFQLGQDSLLEYYEGNDEWEIDRSGNKYCEEISIRLAQRKKGYPKDTLKVFYVKAE